MQLKYQRTLDYIVELPKDEHGLFQINWRYAMEALDISKKTVYRHLDKLLANNGISIVYKGGDLNSQLFQDLRIDSCENPYTFSSSLYSLEQCSQRERDLVIIRDIIGWRESFIKHYLWWSQADSLEYDDNPCGLSEVTTKLLTQYVKYMVNEDFGYNDDCYDGHMLAFEALKK